MTYWRLNIQYSTNLGKFPLCKRLIDDGALLARSGRMSSRLEWTTSQIYVNTTQSFMPTSHFHFSLVPTKILGDDMLPSQTLATSQNLGAPKTPRTLETLPTELLELIFVEALEVNLVRASNVVAAAVSREKVYDIFMVHAFRNNTFPLPNCKIDKCDRETVCDKCQASARKHHEGRASCQRFPQETSRVLPVKDQRALQRTVMSCRWLTIRRLERIYPILLDLAWEALESLVLKCKVEEAKGMLKMRCEPYFPEPQQALTLYQSDRHTHDLRFINNRAIIDRSEGYPRIIYTGRAFDFPEKTSWTSEKLERKLELIANYMKDLT